MSERLSYSFSDVNAGLYCFGLEDVGALTLATAFERLHGAPELLARDAAAGRWEARVEEAYSATLEAIAEPVSFAGGARREWLCRLSGSTRSDGREIALRGFGRVAIEDDGAPANRAVRADLALARSIWISFGEELGFVVSSEQPRRASGHGDERNAGFELRAGVASELTTARLSSTYRADGQLLRAGLELRTGEDEEDVGEDDEDAPRRTRRGIWIGGETVAAGGLAGGPTLVSVAFLACRHNGREGIGGYEIWRPQSG